MKKPLIVSLLSLSLISCSSVEVSESSSLTSSLSSSSSSSFSSEVSSSSKEEESSSLSFSSEDIITVTFVDKNNILNLDSLQVTPGEKISFPLINYPQEYDFAGFYEDEDFLVLYDFDTPLYKSLTLYASWHKYTPLELTLNQYIDSLMANTEDEVPYWNRESYKGKWNYIDGVFLNSLVELYYKYQHINPLKAKVYQAFFLKFINYYITPEGEFYNYIDPTSSGFREGELDSVCESRILFDAYEMTSDSRYLIAIEKTYTSLMKQSRVIGSSNFSHKESYKNQIWLDGMYMYVPFYIRYALLKNNRSIIEEVKQQYTYIKEHMFDVDKKLYYHGYDATKSIFWANSNGTSASFWLRSMGWYLMSLTDALLYVNDEDKAFFTSLLKEALDGILLYQDKDTKMFFQLIDQDKGPYLVSSSYLSSLRNEAYLKNGQYVDTYIENYPETSGSSMVSYALLKASNKGFIDETYFEKGKEVFLGIYDHSFIEGKLHYICVTAGLGPETNTIRDGSTSYYLAEPVSYDDAKGVGPFLSAFIESYKL